MTRKSPLISLINKLTVLKLCPQMTIEVLFLGPDPKLPVQPSSLSIDREYTAVEENTIYYTGGYVLRKLRKSFMNQIK